MKERVITSDACVQEGADFLASHEPAFARALTLTGPLPLRLRRDGFVALLDAIISQQISVAAAAAIRGRMQAAGLSGARAIKDISDDDLRACGLSRPKVRYLRALIEAGVDYRALRSMPAQGVIARLVEIPGIGPWSAEIYVMFSLGRADVFAPGDLALQEAARLLFGLAARPRPTELAEMAQDWAPWRSVAARILWAYYRVEKAREGIR